MEFVKFLLSGHIIFIFITAFSPNGNPNNNFNTLPAHIIPRHYNIELDIEMYTFRGTCNISLDTTTIDTDNCPSNISLHSANLKITSATLIVGLGAFKFNLYKITYVIKQEIAILDFEHKLSPIFNYTLNIVFLGIVDESGGLFRTAITSYGDKEWVIATHNSAIGTRRLFPCWDEPGLKANFTINLKYPDSYNAFSNMPIVSLRWSENNKIMARFATTPAISTYLVAIVLIRLPVISITSVTPDFKLWSRQRIRVNIRDAVDIITEFTQAFENEWPILKKLLIEKHFMIPGWLDNGMDKWQMVFYREENIIYNKKLDPIARKIEVSRLIARKLASQRIGSATGASWWSHMWLHEGIATLLGIDIISKTIPDFRITDLFVVQTLQDSLHLDDLHIMKSLTEVNNTSDLNSLFTFSYYLKGPTILRMLQHLIGIEVFQKGINIYLKKHLASPNDFWSAMQAALNTLTTGQFNITEMMEPWIKQNHYPVLNVTQYSENYIQNNITVKVSIQNTPEARWIPVTYTTQRDINFNALVGHLLQPPASFLNFVFDSASYSEDDWIIFNIQQLGYYRVNYDDKSWKRIALFLSSENYTEIHVLNRAQIIDDAFHFMMLGKLNSSIFWELTSYLSQETDYIAWYPMLKVIERMSHTYPFRESQQVKEMVLSRLVPLLRKIGYKECHPDENNEECPKNHLLKSLRQEAAKWACVFGDVDCRREANAKLRSRLLNLTIDYSLPWWRKWTFCHGLSTADNVTIEKVYDIYLNQNDTKILKFLTCSDNYRQIISILMEEMESIPRRASSTRVKERNKMIPRDFINMFHYIVERYAKDESALDYILSNFSKIKPEKISTAAALIDIINHVYSQNHLDKIYKFMNDDIRPLFAGTGQWVEKMNENYNVFMSKIQSKIDLRSSQIRRHILSYSCTFNFTTGDDKCKHT